MSVQMIERPAPPKGGRLLIAVLAAAGIAVSLMQTLVVPLVPQLPELLGTTPANASWAVTATLLTGAVATPMFGRLGDMFGPKRILVACAVILTVGSVIAAMTSSLAPLVIGRALQGFGAPVIPLGISVLRAALPADRVGGAMGMVSASLGVGGALGLPMSAVIAEHLSWHALFWCAAVLGLMSCILFATLVPDIVPSASMGRFDVLGALGLSAALLLLLLPISKGASWGWTSPMTLGLLIGSIVVFVAFGWWQYRAPTPLVDMRTTLKRPVLLTNLASIAVGFGMFGTSLLGPQLLQMPTMTGYGLGQSMVMAGLWMAPGGLAMMATSPIAGRVIAARGPRFTLILGAVIIAVGYLGGTQLLGSPAGILVFGVVCSTGVGFAFAALPTLINSAVPVSETAAANGINSLARSLGTSTSSAVTSAVLAQMTVVVAGHAFPTLTAFRTAMVIAGCAALLAAVIAMTIPTSVPAPAPSTVEPVLAPIPTRRRAQRLENVLTALGRQAAVALQIPSTPYRLDRGDYVIASYLGADRPLTLAELAREVDSPITAVDERISTLIRDGMVSRLPDTDQAAPPRFALTSSGRATFERQRTLNISRLESIVSRWDDGDVAALIGYLGRLSDGIDEELRRQNAVAPDAAPHTAPHGMSPHAPTTPMRTARPPRPQHPTRPAPRSLRDRWSVPNRRG
ncbi:MFS transporter [Mycolicibacterium wolinskyi]|uniref:MFS transporter n=1 Tax=Mycolicibacterium wolinskyi TaxID=59750 RepID=A0A132PJ17_9MYCO|nr:MFS transporter [Mycolicibacterium wolinskyi]KWX22293.1 MFS transporter [Mycolicibacterium wolinskyi]